MSNITDTNAIHTLSQNLSLRQQTRDALAQLEAQYQSLSAQFWHGPGSKAAVQALADSFDAETRLGMFAMHAQFGALLETHYPGHQSFAIPYSHTLDPETGAFVCGDPV